MMQQLHEAELVDLRESVPCNLCGGDEQEVVYLVDSQKVQLKTLLRNNIEYALHSQESIVRCNACGLIYVNPRLATHSDIETYSDEAETLYFANTRMQRTKAFTHVIERLPHWLGHSPQTLLDIGCGDGLLVELGQAAGISCAGTEQRESLCQQVRAQLGDSAIVSSDITQLASASYDVVCLLNVIEHLRQPKEMIDEIYRLLKPGGILLIHAPNMGGIPAKLQRESWNQIEPFEHFYYFTVKTLNQMLADVGFEPIGRFSLFTASGAKEILQRMLAKMNIYVDNGLGVVSRRPNRSSE